jgi:hypothetical protein
MKCPGADETRTEATVLSSVQIPVGMNFGNWLLFSEKVRLRESGEEGNVFPALTQRGERNGKDMQALPEVFPEGSLPHFRLQVPVGGGNDADIHLQGAGALQAFELPILDQPQQLGLEGRGQLPDFVQEHDTAVGQFEAAQLFGQGAGEGPLFMAEKLALDEGGAERGLVHFYQGPVSPWAGAVDGPGDELLAGAGLP